MRGAHEAQLQLDAITRSHVHTFYLHIFLCVNISALSLGTQTKTWPALLQVMRFLRTSCHSGAGYDVRPENEPR